MQTKFLSYVILLLVAGWQVTLGFSLSGSLNNIRPKGESFLRSSDGIVSLSIYNDSLYIKFNKDASKDYYVELAIDTSGMVLIKNDSSGYHAKQIVNFQ